MFLSPDIFRTSDFEREAFSYRSGGGGGTKGPAKVDKRTQELQCPHCERVFKQVIVGYSMQHELDTFSVLVPQSLIIWEGRVCWETDGSASIMQFCESCLVALVSHMQAESCLGQHLK